MKNYLDIHDLANLPEAVEEALALEHLLGEFNIGRGKTLLMVFFNPSLRTRLSTQKAAFNLGMNVMVLDVNQGAWKLETERGVVMDGDKAEHLLEAIPVMTSYCDIVAVRSFALLQNREDDYSERIINQFVQYGGKPVVAMETATGHPLQALADTITIEQYKPVARPKVVLTWAPHPRALPQAVPNSFAQFMMNYPCDFVIACPEGYELDKRFAGEAKVTHDQEEAFRGAHFIYAKNWSVPTGADYGKVVCTDRSWTVDEAKMALTDNGYFMHCLPIRRNVIATDGVLDSPQSLVIPEAKNRELSASYVLYKILQHLRGADAPSRYFREI